MRIVRTLLLVLLIFCVLFFGALMRSRSHGKRFVAVPKGATETAAVAKLGSPTRIMACAALPEPPDGCARVLVYAVGVSGIMPEFWLLPLDGAGHVQRVLHTTRAD